MSWSTYNQRSNEISYNGYIALGGKSNSKLYTVTRKNGSHIYITYHLR